MKVLVLLVALFAACSAYSLYGGYHEGIYSHTPYQGVYPHIPYSHPYYYGHQPFLGGHGIESESILPYQHHEESVLPWSHYQGTISPWTHDQGSVLPLRQHESTVLPWKHYEGSVLPWKHYEGSVLPYQHHEVATWPHQLFSQTYGYGSSEGHHFYNPYWYHHWGGDVTPYVH